MARFPSDRAERVSPVPEKDGSWRSVINLKQLNAFEFVEAPHFKMERSQTLKSPLKRGDQLVKEDLKDVCFSIPIMQLRTKQIPLLCRSEQHLPLQLPPIRPGFSPMGLNQDLKAGRSSRTGVELLLHRLLAMQHHCA